MEVSLLGTFQASAEQSEGLALKRGGSAPDRPGS